MTNTMNHTDCLHPATKAGRAKCRRDRAAQDAARTDAILEVKARFFAGEGDAEELIYELRAIDPALTEGYYDGTMHIEDIFYSAR